MDGLLGGSQLGTLGLLGLNQDEINRAKGQAQSDMYFALASQLLSGGPTGASIAKGLQMGQKAYRDALSEQTSERMNQLKVAEYIRSQQEAQAAKARQAAAERVLQTGIVPAQPAIPAPTPTGPLSGAAFGEGRAATPASLDLANIAPQLMATPEGRKMLADVVSAQKAIAGDAFNLGEGEKRFRTDISGKTVEVASGAPKQKPLKEVDLGNVVVMLDDQGREVMRMPKGSAPQGPVALQHFETDQGVMSFNPRTGETKPVMADGKPVMGKGSGMTEDQAKATGWLVQAQNAFSNMNKALEEDKKASSPSYVSGVPIVGGTIANISASGPQQRFRQGASSLSEALLRAATGAGMNENEARQKVFELTPQIGDDEDTIKQKMDAIPLYIQTLQFRAGKKGAAAASDIFKSQPTSSGW